MLVLEEDHGQTRRHPRVENNLPMTLDASHGQRRMVGEPSSA